MQSPLLTNNLACQVHPHSLHRFIPDTPYWRIRDLNVQGFPEDETEYDYEPYGPKKIPTGVHFDGTPFEEYKINEIMGCLYELRAYLLLINEKAWEIIVKFVNPIRMYDIHDTFPAAAVLQFIMTEIHMTSQLGTAEILSRATLAFSKVVDTHDTADEMIQDFQNIKELLDQTTTYSVQSVGQVLLNKIVECLQIASQVGTVPAYVNLQRYSMMIAGVQYISKMDHESSHYSFTKMLRSWFGSFVREFQHTKA